jgi:hypothetical protein
MGCDCLSRVLMLEAAHEKLEARVDRIEPHVAVPLAPIATRPPTKAETAAAVTDALEQLDELPPTERRHRFTDDEEE